MNAIFDSAFYSLHLFLYSLFLPSGLSPDYDTPHTGGRTILSVNKDAENDGFKAYTSVIVNSILYLLFFAWLLIKGEPRFPRDSKNVASFKAYMNKADSEAVKVSNFVNPFLYLRSDEGAEHLFCVKGFYDPLTAHVFSNLPPTLGAKKSGKRYMINLHM